MCVLFSDLPNKHKKVIEIGPAISTKYRDTKISYIIICAMQCPLLVRTNLKINSLKTKNMYLTLCFGCQECN